MAHKIARSIARRSEVEAAATRRANAGMTSRMLASIEVPDELTAAKFIAGVFAYALPAYEHNVLASKIDAAIRTARDQERRAERMQRDDAVEQAEAAQRDGFSALIRDELAALPEDASAETIAAVILAKLAEAEKTGKPF